MMLRVICMLSVVAAVAGCASSTQLITNDQASSTVKAKSFTSYREVLLIPPKDDPRNLVPRIAKEIEALGFQVSVMDPNKPIEASQGTGFVIGSAGWLLTAAHVVSDQTVATVTLDGRRFTADIVKSDEEMDLALLKLRETLPADARIVGFRTASNSAAMGEDVFTIGYPLSRILGNSARMSRGLLSATTGLRDNEHQMQVSAEIQPGSSGGPLLDRDGNVIGVISYTLNPVAVAQATGGAMPQNVNFAIKELPVLDFVKGASEQAYTAIGYHNGTGLAQAAKAVAKVQAGIVGPDSDRNDKMVVRFSYVSLWDIWYRFRLFALTAFDYETREPLFAVGQGRDNILSNEDVVIHHTMDQFRKAITSR